MPDRKRPGAPKRPQGSGNSPYMERIVDVPGPLDRKLASVWSRVEANLLARRRLHQMGLIADAALELAPAMGALSEATLRAEALRLRADLVADGLQAPGIARAFALAREATRRHLGLVHHRVQLIGGATMLGRRLAEMETGEGKTITALLPATLFALAGRPVHVVTVNDYLAQRDAEQLQPVYAALGLRAGVVTGEKSVAERREAYQQDITYCTNKDLVFDYLRDRLALGTRRSRSRRFVDELAGEGWDLADGQPPGQQGGRQGGPLFLRGLEVAIVDEADSVLIDEARTPLILSEQVPGGDDGALYAAALGLARNLAPKVDYLADGQRRQASLTPAGRERVAALAEGMTGLWAVRRAREELAEKALLALHFFERGSQYVVAEGKVQIVDEFTGRVMPDRTWEHGLHQMVEAKEGCNISGKRRTIAKITFQRFFGRYAHLCGMTGTAAESRAELAATFGLSVLKIPTHNTLRRADHGTALVADAAAKWAFVAARAGTVSAAGRAVLIGTRSVEASEAMAERLQAAGKPPAVLNAQQSREEAAIVARGGQAGALTVATNMAGRGTDIRLSRAVREAGGLHVILTEFHESARIDRQLFGRCGRQGDPGSVEAVVALDDEMFQRFAGRRLLMLARLMLRRGPLPAWAVRALRGVVQRRAERMNAATRRDTLKEDARLDRSLAFAGRGE